MGNKNGRYLEHFRSLLKFLNTLKQIYRNILVTMASYFGKMCNLIMLKAVKVGHKFLLPVGNKWNSFVKFRRLPGGHTCHIKRATCNILIFLRNIIILKKLISFLNNLYLYIVDTMLLV